jgi:hypothetical protein
MAEFPAPSEGIVLAYERVLGPGHPGTLTTRGDLARFTGEAGNTAGARGPYAALLPVYERVLGPGTRTPWPPGTTSPTGHGRQAVAPGLA